MNEESARFRIAAGAAIGLLILIMVISALPPLVSAVAFELLSGWLRFLWRVVPAVHLRWDGIAIFVGGLFVAVYSGHSIATWLVAERNKAHAAEPSVGRVVRWSWRSSTSLLLLVLTVFVVGICMTGVVHQIGWLLSSPEPWGVAHRQSASDAKLSMYDAESQAPGLSWIYSVLVYLPAVPPEVDHDLPFNAATNAPGFRTVVPSLICPSQGNPTHSFDGFGLSHLAANSDVINSQEKLRMAQISSASQTMLVGEVNAGFAPWAAPLNTRDLQLGIRMNWSGQSRGEVGYGSQHPAGINVAMIDASTRTISFNVDAKVLQQLSKLKLPNNP